MAQLIGAHIPFAPYATFQATGGHCCLSRCCPLPTAAYSRRCTSKAVWHLCLSYQAEFAAVQEHLSVARLREEHSDSATTRSRLASSSRGTCAPPRHCVAGAAPSTRLLVLYLTSTASGPATRLVSGCVLLDRVVRTVGWITDNSLDNSNGHNRESNR